MRNIDVMAAVLSEVTNQPAQHWRRTMLAAVGASGGNVADTQLLTELSDVEANDLLTKLRAAKQGILAWVVQGAKLAHAAPPHHLNRAASYMNNRRN